MALTRTSEGSTLTDTLRIEELLTPAAFPHPVEHLELRETHISWIVLTGTLAYKIKKPVKFDFIDASTLERRLYYCKEELRLNQRLAPEIYLDVVPITRSGRGVRVGDSPGPAIEFAVCMHQFETASELTELLKHDAVGQEEVARLAEQLAEFHRKAPVAAWNERYEKTEWMYDAVLGNLAQLVGHLQQIERLPHIERLVDWTHDAANALEEPLEARERSGFIRECHGDLHCANVVRWNDRLVPFDCIDFDARLRWIDVISDLAFLVMDLHSRGRDELAAVLLSRYLEVSGDYEGVRLLPFYCVYRALVGAKVDAIASEQSPARSHELYERLRLRLQEALEWTGRPTPTLTLMHGLSGSGKSWLSERLIPALRAIRVRSDLERKRLNSQLTADRPRGVREGVYAPEMSHRTYARLLDCAESCLQAGFNVIVDAAFLDQADRELMRGLARRLEIPFLIVSCSADRQTLAARIDQRMAGGSDPSDAGRTVLAAQLQDYVPLRPAEARHAITVDTGDPQVLERVIAAFRSVLQSRPARAAD